MATHIANTPGHIDGIARCAAESALGAGGAVDEAGADGTDITVADTTLEMEVKPCVKTCWRIK